MGAIFLEYLLIQGIHLTVRLVRFRPSSARLSPPRPGRSFQTFSCKDFTSSIGSPMHFATVSGAMPSARRLLASDNAFSAAPSSRPSARRPCPQVLQRHPVVAKGSSIGSLARPPCPKATARSAEGGGIIWSEVNPRIFPQSDDSCTYRSGKYRSLSRGACWRRH